MKRLSTIMPPSSRPDLRWNCWIESVIAPAGHCSALTRAGPVKWPRHTTSAGMNWGRSRKPALAADMAPLAPSCEALPSDCRVAPSQQAMSIAWREGNSITWGPSAWPWVRSANQSGASERWVS